MMETAGRPIHRVGHDRAMVAMVTALCAPLFLYGLGHTYLWQDEAQTALLGRSVLRHGVPMVGSGSDSLSAHAGADAGVGGLYLQIAWLQAYVTAGSFALLGESSWAARLPFALAGWLCVPLVGLTLRRGGVDPWAVAIASALTAFSVPFIIAARHARYYPLAALSVLLVVAAYLAVARGAGDGGDGRRERRDMLALGGAGCVAVLSFDLTAVGVLAAITLHWLATAPSPARWSPRFWLPVVGAGVLLTAWIGLTLTAESRQAVGGLLDRLPERVAYYAGQLNAHVVPVPVFAALLGLVGARRVAARDSRDQGVAALLAVVLVTGILAAVLAPLRFFRYLAPLIPIALALAAIGLTAVARRGAWGRVLVAGVVLALVTSTALHVWSHELLATTARATGLVAVQDREVPYRLPLSLLLTELRSPPRGPIAAVVEYLRANASPGDTLVTDYGDLPLKFHTNLDVYGGETGELPPSEVTPEWVWPRPVGPRRWEALAQVTAWLETRFAREAYRRIELATVDRLWENREDPALHVFSDPGPPGPPVTLFASRPGPVLTPTRP